jgi:hypothetical protein
MGLLDIKITQGAYWGGAQVNYWLYLFLACFPLTGILGLDHLVLRSPVTFLLKILSIIPLFGFWYFYDIAQATGERELIEKYGLGVPFYGPIGLGQGMFITTKDSVSPPKTPRPWLFMLYVFFTIACVAFPINKLIIGDYWGFLGQFCTLLSPIFFMAIFWGFYDVYKAVFDTRDILEKGPERIFPASWFMAKRYDSGVLGPRPPGPTAFEAASSSIIGKAFEAAIIVPKTAANVTAGIIGAVGTATKGLITATGSAGEGIIDGAAGVVEGAESGAKTAAQGIGNAVASASGAVGSVFDAAKESAGAVTALAKVAEELPGAVEAAKGAATAAQKGGALLNPSVSSSVLLFGVGLLAFGGYVMYAMRKHFEKTRNDRSDDSPPDPRAVRRASEAN